MLLLIRETGKPAHKPRIVMIAIALRQFGKVIQKTTYFHTRSNTEVPQMSNINRHQHKQMSTHIMSNINHVY